MKTKQPVGRPKSQKEKESVNIRLEKGTAKRLRIHAIEVRQTVSAVIEDCLLKYGI